MFAAWGVEGLEKVLVLGSIQERNTPQDEVGTCAVKQEEVTLQNHQLLSKCLAWRRVGGLGPDSS